MAFEQHIIERAGGTNRPAIADRCIVGVLVNVANNAGGGAGQSVTTTISGLRLPANYAAIVMPNQDAVAYVASKTQAGFNVVLNPRLAANTLSSGTFDVLILA